jgi:Tol biopolymer transport system component
MVGSGDYNLHPAGLFRPPDGRQIAFVDGSIGITVADADGSHAVQILQGPRPEIPYRTLRGIQWSPDGSKIAFMASLGGPEPWRVFVMNADGSDLHLLTTAHSLDDVLTTEAHPTWSPDGTRIALVRWYQQGDDPRPITIVDVATGKETEIGNIASNGFFSFAWSPDGRELVELPKVESNASSVVIVDTATGQSRELSRWRSSSSADWQRVAP